MTLTIPDDISQVLGTDEAQVRLELACALFDADKLTAAQAALLSGLDRAAFEVELERRGITLFRFTVEEFQQDMQTWEAWQARNQTREGFEERAA
jgi:predicted HTH domain antitoxin